MTNLPRITPRALRLPSALATVAAVGLALTGCAAPGSGSSAPAVEQEDITGPVTAEQVAELGDITLRMWADQAEEPLMEEVVPAFEQQYPNVTVDITYKSFDDLVATVVNAAASDSPPDVFQGNIGYAVDGALVKAGLVRPLDDVASAYGWDEGTGASTLAPARWDENGTTFGEGTLFGMSPISEVQGIYSNTSKLQALGIEAPDSLEELEAALPVALAAGDQPIMLGNSDQYAGTHIFSDIAATLQDPADISAWIGGAAGSTFETEGNVEAAATMAEWAQAGYLGAGYDGLSNEDAIAAYAGGTGVFFVGGSWNGASLTSDGFEMGALASGGVGATASPWHISSRSENSVAAVAWLDMLHSPEVGQQILDTGRLPVITDGVTASNPLQEQTLEALKATIAAGTQVGYYDWTATDMLTSMGGGLQEVMAGRTSPEDFTATVQATWADTHDGR